MPNILKIEGSRDRKSVWVRLDLPVENEGCVTIYHGDELDKRLKAERELCACLADDVGATTAAALIRNYKC